MDSVSRRLMRMEDPDYRVRRDACEQWGLEKDLPEEAIIALQRALHDHDPRVADAARRALHIHGPVATPSSTPRPPTTSQFKGTPAPARSFHPLPWLLLLAVALGLFLTIQREDMSGPFVISLLILAGILYQVYAWRIHQRWTDALTELAGQTGLELNPGRPAGVFGPGYPSGLTGLYHGRQVSISRVMRNRSGQEAGILAARTRIVVQVKDLGICRLHVTPGNFLARAFHRKAARSGDADFDRRFHFEGSPKGFLQRAMQLMVRYPLLLDRSGGVITSADSSFSSRSWSRPSIHLEASSLERTQFETPGQIYEQVSILNLLCDLAEMAELEAPDRIASGTGAGPDVVVPSRRTVPAGRGFSFGYLVLLGMLPVIAFVLFALFQADPTPTARTTPQVQTTEIAAMRASAVAVFKSTGTAGADMTSTAAALSMGTAMALAPNQLMRDYMATLQPSVQQQHGPYTGELTHDASNSYYEDFRLNMRTKDFIASVTFLNPYAVYEGGWDYGFVFRADHEYRLVLRSYRQWQLVDFLSGTRDKIVASGQVPSLDIGRNGSNRIWLLCRGQKGSLFVNGEFVADFDLSGSKYAGDVAIATGMFHGEEKNGFATGYEDFTVWQLP